MIEQADLDTLTKILLHFVADDEGTRIGALNTFRARLRSKKIDVRELKLMEGSGIRSAVIDYYKEVASVWQQRADDAVKTMDKYCKHNEALLRLLAIRDAELEALRKTPRYATSNKQLEAKLKELEVKIKELEVELQRYRDPWQQKIEAWLKTNPETRIYSSRILAQALGLRASEMDVKAHRRLADIMRRIGGWAPSENIGGVYNRGRGYIKS